MTLKQQVQRQTGLVIPDSTGPGLELKNAIQEAISKLPDRFLVLELVTGLGKTKACLQLSEGLKTLILCKQREHFKTWTDEIQKWGLHPSELRIECYQSLHKLAGEQFDIVILDEAQGLSEARLESLKKVRYNRIVAATATIPEEVFGRLMELGTPRVVKIPFNVAVKWELIPRPNINVIQVPLDRVRKYLIYKRYNKQYKEQITIDYSQYPYYKFRRYNLDIRCTEQEYYNIIQEEFEQARKKFFGDTSNDWLETDMLRKGGDRKRFLAEIRTPKVQQLLDKLHDRRLIVFCNTIEQADKLANGGVTVHSKSEEKDAVERFNSGEINRIYTVNMLDESINVNGQFTAVIVSLGGSTVKSVQRLGRTTRHANSELFIFITPNTQDDKYFQTFSQELNPDYFNYLI